MADQKLKPEDLVVDEFYIISPETASESEFLARLDEVKYNNDGSIDHYVFVDGNDDYWGCDFDEIVGLSD